MNQGTPDNADVRLAALLTVAEQQQGSINQLTVNVATLGQNIDRLGERLDGTIERLGTKIDLLMDGTGQLLEGLTEMKVTAQQQAQNIERLVGVVEQLISRG